MQIRPSEFRNLGFVKFKWTLYSGALEQTTYNDSYMAPNTFYDIIDNANALWRPTQLYNSVYVTLSK